MGFPKIRPRRLRKGETLRKMVAETEINASDLILPLFATHGKKTKKPIGSMPGHFQMSVDLIAKEAEEVHALGIPAVILFGIPEVKDPAGKAAYAAKGPVQEAIRAIKRAVPELLVITDVCMCEVPSPGHCGIIKDGGVDNDSTLKLLAKEALSHVEAGADIVAPSDMMDGRVAAIRDILDNNGFVDTSIMSSTAKYGSAFYGPHNSLSRYQRIRCCQGYRVSRLRVHP